MKSIQVRQLFIDFFKSKGHQPVPSAPVVPENDPTLLFTNAGMNPFKPYFLGTQQSPYPRVVNTQPCIRVSGKHNDLDDVGLDTYHHTAFEMLGNWSFGDYYKKEAIQWAWELLTQGYGLPKQQLVVTVHQDDDEAAALWAAATDIHPDRIVRCPDADNFWDMGATGPCGPCSEIHLDLDPNGGRDIHRNPHTGGLSNRYMELWNLVFIQYNRQDDGGLMPLAMQHVDTGAGLERLTAQLQGVSSNYDTDCFQALIQAAESILKVPYDSGKAGIPHRVIADHMRTVTWAISDNVLPSNEGRGYVLRRLIRRALRFASMVGVNRPFLHQLVPIVNDSLGGYYPNIGARESVIRDLIQAEEKQFLRTVSTGLTLFSSVVATAKAANQSGIDGETAFKLYDTYGFPFDLTQVMATEQGLTVDEAGFHRALDAQRNRSRDARSETVKTGTDDTIIADSSVVKPVHAGVYVDAPGGGEARIPANDAQRFGIAQHHTATHLVHAALRRVLGESVQQAGSLVDVNRLRFDFTHHQSLSDAQMTAVADHVNAWIQSDYAVTISEESLAAAKKRGVLAMFGEKYGERVRVVTIDAVSLELCGGNHVHKTGDLEVCKLLGESAVAAGVRRIEALVGNDRVANQLQQVRDQAWQAYQKRYETLRERVVSSKATVDMPEPLPDTADADQIAAAMTALTELAKTIERDLNRHHDAEAAQLVTDILPCAQPLAVGNGSLVVAGIPNRAMSVVRQLTDRLMDALGDSVVVVIATESERCYAIARVANPLQKQVSAATIIQEITHIMGGKGGGRPAMAQAGGLDSQCIEQAVAWLRTRYA
jgi:alanyl-tRNA synthetase